MLCPNYSSPSGVNRGSVFNAKTTSQERFEHKQKVSQYYNAEWNPDLKMSSCYKTVQNNATFCSTFLHWRKKHIFNVKWGQWTKVEEFCLIWHFLNMQNSFMQMNAAVTCVTNVKLFPEKSSHWSCTPWKLFCKLFRHCIFKGQHKQTVLPPIKALVRRTIATAESFILQTRWLHKPN